MRIYEGMEKLGIEGKKGVPGPLVRKQTTEEEDMAFFEKRYQERVPNLKLFQSVEQEG